MKERVQNIGALSPRPTRDHSSAVGSDPWQGQKHYVACVAVHFLAVLASIGLVQKSAADPRPTVIVDEISYSLPYAFNMLSMSTLSVPVRHNSRGTIYSILYEFINTEHIRAHYTVADSPNGSVDREISRIGFDLTRQNGVMSETTATRYWTCIGGDCTGYEIDVDFVIPRTIDSIAWNPALKSKIDPVGGSVETRIEWFTEGTGTVRIDGTGSFDGTLRITYTYDSKTTAEYAADVFRDIALLREGPIERNRSFYQWAIFLRENSYPGSSVNENIRDLEYFARGFQGGNLLANSSVMNIDSTDWMNDVSNILIPISAPIYNELKSLGLTPPSNEHVASSAGGTEDAIKGWEFGLAGATLEEALEAHFGTPGGLPTPLPRPIAPAIGLAFSVSPTPIRLALPVDKNAVVRVNLFPVRATSSSTVLVASPGAGDSLVVGSGLSASGVTVLQTGDVAGTFTIESGTFSRTAPEGEIVVLPTPVSGEQTFRVSRSLLSESPLPIQLSFAQETNGMIGVVELKLVSPESVRGPVTIDDMKMRVLPTSEGPAILVVGPPEVNAVLQTSTNLTDWTPTDTLERFAGTKWISFPISPGNSALFYRLAVP